MIVLVVGYTLSVIIFLAAAYWAASKMGPYESREARAMAWTFCSVWPLFIVVMLFHRGLIKLFGDNRYD